MQSIIEDPKIRNIWLLAIDAEINSLKQNKIRVVEKPASGKRVIGCMWMFKKKMQC